MFHLPGAALFRDFCGHLARKLPHTFVRGAAVNVDKGSDGVYDVIVAGSAKPVRARSVVFALGAAGAPRIPAPMSRIHDAEDDAASPRIVHTFQWSKLQTMKFRGETVLVVGGGLSAAQAALLAVRRGASRVVHASRRPVQSRHFDIPIEWLDPQAGWHVAERDSRAGKGTAGKFRLFEFYETPKEERADWVKSARGGASIPATYYQKLEHEAMRGRLERCVDEVATTTVCEDGGAIRVVFCGETEDIVADRIILATGSKLDVNAVPLLRQASTRFDLPQVGALPNIDDNLQWGDESFTVVGAFALLEIGPDAGNLSGCRRCAERCADNLGAFEMFTNVGAFRTNTFGALFDSDSSDSCDSDCCDDGDSCATSEESGVRAALAPSPPGPEPSPFTFPPLLSTATPAQVEEQKAATLAIRVTLLAKEVEINAAVLRSSYQERSSEKQGDHVELLNAAQVMIRAAIDAADVAIALCDIKCWTLREEAFKQFTHVGSFRIRSESVLFGTGCEGECEGECGDSDRCAKIKAALDAAQDAIASCA